VLHSYHGGGLLPASCSQHIPVAVTELAGDDLQALAVAELDTTFAHLLAQRPCHGLGILVILHRIPPRHDVRFSACLADGRAMRSQ
jgi:hypothetical protein